MSLQMFTQTSSKALPTSTSKLNQLNLLFRGIIEVTRCPTVNWHRLSNRVRIKYQVNTKAPISISIWYCCLYIERNLGIFSSSLPSLSLDLEDWYCGWIFTLKAFKLKVFYYWLILMIWLHLPFDFPKGGSIIGVINRVNKSISTTRVSVRVMFYGCWTVFYRFDTSAVYWLLPSSLSQSEMFLSHITR